MLKAINATDLLRAAANCKVFYKKKAWMKTILLVANRNQEVGWHGIVKRAENNPAKFIVEDILVYPQEVTATSITTDMVEYMNWQDSLDADIFNSVRLQAHSHVNMGVMPSSVDMKYREDLLTDIDDFYIFQILNKTGYISSQVYDIEAGILYENDQVETVLESFDPLVYDICVMLFNEWINTHDLQNGVGWFASIADEFKEFMDRADSVIAEHNVSHFVKNL